MLVPLGALGVAAIAVVPAWRARFGVAVLAITTAGLVAVPVATRSGHQLEERIKAGGVVAKQIHRHETWGSRVIYPTVALWLLALALVLLDRRGRRHHGGRKRSHHGGRGGRGSRSVTAVAVLAVLAAGAAAAVVTIAGHLGTTAVWSCTIGSSACK